jgi:hypothetical protein
MLQKLTQKSKRGAHGSKRVYTDQKMARTRWEKRWGWGGEGLGMIWQGKLRRRRGRSRTS